MLKDVGVERQEAEYFFVAFDHVEEINSESRFSPNRHHKALRPWIGVWHSRHR